MKRLSALTQDALPESVIRPHYERAVLRPGLLHLGVGAFHRAHQAVYTDAALNHSGGNWGIIGVSLRSDSVARQLTPQDGLYTVRSEDASSQQTRLIGALLEVLVAPQAASSVDAWIARPEIKVITLTITEKGYCLGADGWSLDFEHEAIQRDLADPKHAHSAIGVLARGLQRRLENGGAALTIISCDNLTENSARLRRVLVDYLQACYPKVLPWLDDAATFPCSMVDRIVPAASDASLAEQAERLGLRDEAAIITEPFSQWIIEDKFAADIPDWQAVGVQLVPDIRPFETAKLRLLNASHSAIAYIGLLLNKDTVSDVMADDGLGRYVHALMTQDLIPALQAPEGFDLHRYSDELLQRFANPKLHHRCAQIAMDGSEKIRQRWLVTLENLPEDSLLLRALASWCHLVLATDIPLDDPRREGLLALRGSSAPLHARLRELLEYLHINASSDAGWQNRLDVLAAHCKQVAAGGLRTLLTAS